MIYIASIPARKDQPEADLVNFPLRAESILCLWTAIGDGMWHLFSHNTVISWSSNMDHLPMLGPQTPAEMLVIAFAECRAEGARIGMKRNMTSCVGHGWARPAFEVQGFLVSCRGRLVRG